MKVILRTDVEKLGKARDVVDVSDGYARNYLFPRKLAYLATPKSMRILEDEKKKEEALKERERRELEAQKTKMEGISCTIVRQSGQENKLFGSVTASDIEEALLAKGFKIDKKQVELKEPIREFGIYTVPVRLGAEVVVNLKIWVVKE